MVAIAEMFVLIRNRNNTFYTVHRRKCTLINFTLKETLDFMFNLVEKFKESFVFMLKFCGAKNLLDI